MAASTGRTCTLIVGTRACLALDIRSVDVFVLHLLALVNAISVSCLTRECLKA